MNVLITGSTGLIGSNLLLKLQQNSVYDITATSRRSGNINIKNINFIQGDLTDFEFCKMAVKDQEVIIHCAAHTTGAFTVEKSPLDHVTENIVINAQLLDAAYKAQAKRFIFISSSTVYSDNDGIPVKENDDIFCKHPYHKYYPVGWMKRYTETLCYMYSKILNPSMQCIIIRPSNIFGPGDKFDLEKCHVTPALVKKAVDRYDPIEVWGDGNDIRDILYIDDFVRALELVLNQVYEYNIFNIGYGQSFSVSEILDKILNIENYHPQIIYDLKKPRMIPIRRLDTSKAKELLGFSPQLTIDQGLQKTINWYKTQGIKYTDETIR